MKKLMCGSDYDQVEEACNILIEDLGIKIFPVKCFEVAWLLGIEIKKYSEIPPEDREKVVSKTEDGYSAKIGDRFFIYYNARPLTANCRGKRKFFQAAARLQARAVSG